MRHELKIWPQYFEPVMFGTKTFEVRENDRGFQPGDTVALREYDPTVVEKVRTDFDGMCDVRDYYKEPAGYTGKSVEFLVGYVLPIDEKRVVFSLLPIPKGAA